MKIQLLFLPVVLFFKVNAQIYFGPPSTAFATGTSPFSVISADFNGDGKKDLATANSNSNNISILLGTGIGSFGLATNFVAGTAPFGLVSADFDGDTKTDLAVCNSGSNNVSVLLGNGAGGFSSVANFAAGTGPRSITAGDFNGDTKIDLATANNGSGNVSVLLGDGIGGFAAAINFTVGANPRSVICAYLNADANLDLAVCNEISNNVSILLGTGTGSFGAATNFPVGTNPRSLVAVDFNGDGVKDIATANGGTNNISVIIGSGTGTFSGFTNFSSGSTPYALTAADFNTDGKADLAVANLNSDNLTNISVFIGNGSGSFAPAIRLASTVWTVSSSPCALVSGDFNGDSKPDIVVANNAYNSLCILKSYIPTVGTCPNPMRIVILGASTSFGFGASVLDSGYAYRFRQFIIDSVNGFSSVINLAHAGYTTYAMQPTGYPAPGTYPVDTLRNITKAISLNPDGVIFNFTTNDINALISLDTTIKNLQRATTMLKALGIPYWITTTQPRNFTGDPPATITQKKQMILDLRDTIIKLYPNNHIESYLGFSDASGDILPQFDSGDHTHFTNAGHQLLFNNFKNAKIDSVLCVSVSTGVDGQTATHEMNVYPNPTNGKVNVQIGSYEHAQMSVYTMYGECIYQQTCASSNPQIDLRSQPGGVYFLKVNTMSGIVVKKIIKE